MKKNIDYYLLVLATAIAPAIWGSTYFVTTSFLPQGYPLTVALMRALPAGILLLLFVRKLPTGLWWARVFVLGALNFAFFWSMLFISAYRLPGGWRPPWGRFSRSSSSHFPASFSERRSGA